MRKVFLYFFVILGLVLMAFRFFQGQLRGPWEIILTDESITQSTYLKVSSERDTFIINKIDDSYWLSLTDMSFPIEEEKVNTITSTLVNLKTSRRIKKSRMNSTWTDRVDFVYKDSVGEQEQFALLVYDEQIYYESALSGDLFKLERGSGNMDLDLYISDFLLPSAFTFLFDQKKVSYATFTRDSTSQVYAIDSMMLNVFNIGETTMAAKRPFYYDYAAELQLYSKDSSLLKAIDVLVDSTANSIYLQQQNPYKAGFTLDSAATIHFRSLVQF